MNRPSDGRSTPRRRGRPPSGRNGSGAPRHPAFNHDDEFEQRRVAILLAAIQAFNAHGFHATSTETIAADLGLTKGTLYHYFKSKSDLLYQCCLYSIDSGQHAAERAEATGGNGLKRLENYLRLQFETLAGGSGSGWISIQIMPALPEAQRRDVLGRSRVVDRMVQKFISDGVADGSIGAVDPKVTEFFVIGALNWMPRWYSPQGAMGRAELCETFLRVVFDGLRARDTDTTPRRRSISR